MQTFYADAIFWGGMIAIYIGVALTKRSIQLSREIKKEDIGPAAWGLYSTQTDKQIHRRTCNLRF
ncbi:MAG: hypothetical protein K2X77_20470 [Candidatus Obscuribacterales bacterium]|nr:hypothetical protein [Candidatus Obscuribacterales bacterium]